MRKSLCLFMFLCWTTLVSAQSSGSKGFMEKRKQSKEEKISKGLPFLTPVIGPGYTPDAGLILAVGGLLTFKTDLNDSLIQRSSIPIIFGASTKGNITIGANLRSFWWQDLFRLNIAFSINDANDDYFGVGYNNAIQIPA